MNIGFFLRKIRKERYHTLKDVALHVGLTPSLVSQIENGKTSPSLSSLDALLKYYKISLSDFFKQMEQKDHIYVPKAEVETIDYESTGARLSLLASKLHKNVIESYIVELLPAAKIDLHTSAIKNEGERFVYILSGSLEAAVENEIILMSKGDSLNFKSHLPCRLCNLSVSENCKILITGTPDIF